MNSRARGALAVICSAAAIFFPGALTFGFPGVMAPYWQDLFGVGQGATGNTLFFLLAAVGIFMFLVGKWQEKVGIRVMMLVGGIICAFNVLTVVYATNIYMVYMWAFVSGMGTSFVYIPAMTTVQRWFPSRRGLVSGIVNLVYGFSAAIMVPVFSILLLSMGYISMNLLAGALTLAVGVVAAQFTDTPEGLQQREKKKLDKLSAQGIQDSVSRTMEQDVWKKKEQETGTPVPAGKMPADAVDSLKRDRVFSVKDAVRTRSFWLLWLVWALQGAAGIAMVTLSVGFGISMGFPLDSAVFILTTFNITNGLSRIVTGYFSDIVGRNLTMALSFFAAGLAYFLLGYVHTLALAAVLAAVIGFSFGTLFAVSVPLISDCFGLKHFGAIMGLVFTAYGFLAGILGPSLGGYILDVTEGNFLVVFIYLGIFCLISGVLISFVVPPELEDNRQGA